MQEYCAIVKKYISGNAKFLENNNWLLFCSKSQEWTKQITEGRFRLCFPANNNKTFGWKSPEENENRSIANMEILSSSTQYLI